MDLVEDNKQYIKDLNIIFFKVLPPKSRAAKCYCKKCKDVCAYLTRMQEHILEDHCCEYCVQTFSSKTEKESHRKYMCKLCEIKFSQSVQLHFIWRVQQQK